MKNNKETLELGFNIKKNARLINHFTNIPESAVKVEFKYFNLIHPNGSENVESILEGKKSFLFIHSNSILSKEELITGGVYAIVFPNNFVYIGESYRNTMGRLDYHLDNLRNSTHRNKKMQNQYNKCQENEI